MVIHFVVFVFLIAYTVAFILEGIVEQKLDILSLLEGFLIFNLTLLVLWGKRKKVIKIGPVKKIDIDDTNGWRIEVKDDETDCKVKVFSSNDESENNG
jgi:hypothetical protein